MKKGESLMAHHVLKFVLNFSPTFLPVALRVNESVGMLGGWGMAPQCLPLPSATILSSLASRLSEPLTPVPSYPWFRFILSRTYSQKSEGIDRGRLCAWQRRERERNREGRQSLNVVIRHHFILPLLIAIRSLLLKTYLFIHV